MCDYEAKYSAIIVDEDKMIEHKCTRRSTGKADEDGKKYCIFHSRREDKDVEKFYKEFKKLYDKGEHDFTGFVFPKDFSFTRLREETGDLKFVDAVFALVHFLCDVNFIRAEFSCVGGTNFREAQFSSVGGTYFLFAQFSGEGETNFKRAKFSGELGTYFVGAQFSCEGGTDFSWAEFSDKDGTNFGLARFSGEGVTDFSKTRFSGKGWTDFNNVRFSSKGGTNFSFARFSGEGKVDFGGRLFSYDIDVDFRNVSFEKPENVTFDGINLNRCQFDGTDLEHVNIKEVFWRNKKPGRKWRLGRIKVYEDTLQTAIFKCGGEKNHYRVYQLYNQLLLNYERTYRHHEAGDFYAGQMDMRRRGNFDKKIFSLILLSLYKIIAEYGERPVRVFGWLLFTLLIFGLIYSFWVGINGPSSVAEGGFLSELFKGIRLSLETMTLGKIEIFKTNYVTNYKDNPWVIFAKVLNVISGTSLLTLFLLSVRRRFRKP